MRWLERSLEARYSDIVNGAHFEDYAALENYAEMSHSSLLYLLLEILGVDRQEKEIQYAASHVGVSSGIAALLRSHAYHARIVSRLDVTADKITIKPTKMLYMTT